MENFLEAITDALGGLTPSQKQALEKAHNIYHKRITGPIPFDTQVAIAILADTPAKKTPVKKKVASK